MNMLFREKLHDVTFFLTCHEFKVAVCLSPPLHIMQIREEILFSYKDVIYVMFIS